MRAEKQQQNKLNRALKKATSESSKENSPNERLRQMIVILDTSLSENAELMAELASEMKEAGVEYRVSSEFHPGSVRWRRKVTERCVSEDAEVRERLIPVVSMLVWLMGSMQMINLLYPCTVCSFVVEGEMIQQVIVFDSMSYSRAGDQDSE